MTPPLLLHNPLSTDAHTATCRGVDSTGASVGCRSADDLADVGGQEALVVTARLGLDRVKQRLLVVAHVGIVDQAEVT
eukprot:scaffold1095_cov63-Phaeocystis_antarctica.AAC.1